MGIMTQVLLFDQFTENFIVLDHGNTCASMLHVVVKIHNTHQF